MVAKKTRTLPLHHIDGTAQDKIKRCSFMQPSNVRCNLAPTYHMSHKAILPTVQLTLFLVQLHET